MKKSRERFQEIVKVFAKYGFGYVLESGKKNKGKFAINLRKAFEELGPTFIKIGQILSTRSDILPKEYTNELIKLQDDAPKEELEQLKKTFEESIGKTIEEYFLEFNEVPLASASIAEVHEAVLLDGTSVVVKIQRADIKEKMKMDISILKRILRFTKTKFNIKFIDPLEVLEEIEYLTESELDFIKEAKNIIKFKENNKQNKSIYEIGRASCRERV